MGIYDGSKEAFNSCLFHFFLLSSIHDAVKMCAFFGDRSLIQNEKISGYVSKCTYMIIQLASSWSLHFLTPSSFGWPA